MLLLDGSHSGSKHIQSALVSDQTDEITQLSKRKRSHIHNPLITYLNINSLRYEIIDLRKIISYTDIDLISITETKIDSSFPDAQFLTENYLTFRCDRNKHGGGILTFVKNGLLPKHIPDLESNIIEILPLEIRIDKSKWIVLNVYRPPTSNIQSFIDELSNTLDKSLSKYDSIIVMGDINIDTTEAEEAKLTNRLLKELCITYDLSNLVTESTCITYTHESSIDIILTNRKQSFMLSKAVETGLSDFHKMVTTFMRNTYSRQEPIKILYCNYSNFDKTKFIEDFERSNHYPPQPKKDVNSEYNNLFATIQKVLNKHAPLKSRIIRGNQVPFMNKELSKAIMKRSQLKTKYNKTKQEVDRNAHKKQ